MRHTTWWLWLSCIAACGRVAGSGPDATPDGAPGNLPCEQRASPCGESWAGTGGDGDLNVTAATDLVAAGFTTPLPVTTIDGDRIGVSARDSHLARGDEILLLYARGAAGDIASIGNYETAFVDSVSDTEIALRAPLQRSYPKTAGAATGSTVIAMRVPQFNNLMIGAQGSLSAAGFDGTIGGALFLRAQHVDVQQGGQIAMTGAGHRGGGPASNGVSGDSGESYVTGTIHGGSPYHGAGGGGKSNCETYSCSSQSLGAGAGGAGHGAMGAAGASNGSLQIGGLPGDVYGDAPLASLLLGTGGGGGAGGMNGPGSVTAGGNGGGILVIRADTVHIAGSVVSAGQSGSINNNCSASNGSGSGGAGAGGTVWISSRILQIEGTIRATGGAASCHGGGAGGDGRIRLDFASINGAAVGSSAATAAVNATTMPPPGFVGSLP